MSRIIGPVLTVTIFSAVVVYAFKQGKPVTMTNAVTPLLAVVVSGLVIEFVICDPHGVCDDIRLGLFWCSGEL